MVGKMVESGRPQDFHCEIFTFLHRLPAKQNCRWLGGGEGEEGLLSSPAFANFPCQNGLRLNEV